MNNNNTNRLLVLDSLRGIAALLVVLFHYTMDRPQAKYGFELGTTGVDLFFIISGFVIYLSLNKVSSAYQFIVNRVSRLYPTYWVSVTFTFILIISLLAFENQDFGDTIKNYFWNLSMFQFYAKVPDLDGPYWTMIIEMLFYILMLVLYIFRFLNYSSIIGLCLAVFFTTASHFCKEYTFAKTIIIDFPLLQFISLFFAGVCFYEIYTYKKNLILNYTSILIFLICQILMFNYSGRSHIFISHTQYSLMLIIYFGLFTLLVNNKLNFIVTKTTLFIGRISFALYLIHQYFGVKFMIPKLMENFNLNFWVAAILITLPITIMIATLITFYIEIPLNKKIRKKLIDHKN